MRALTANLATRPFRNNTVIGSIVAAAAAGLLLATIYNLYIFLSYGSSYALLLEDQERNRTKLESLEVEERSLVKKIDARDFATVFHQGSVANELILKRTFSWTELFNKLENLMPRDVMMSAIRPNVTANDIVIRVEGVAKTHLAFLTLQENLLTHDSFSEVYPVSIRRLNPSRPELNFILNFNYRQSEPVPGDTVVAEGAAPPPSAAPPAAKGGGAADERAALQEEVLRAAAAANMLPVGRDGRPRTLEVIARRMVAPGGVYEPPAQVLSAAAQADAQGDGRPQDGVAESGTEQGTSASTATMQAGAATSNATQDASAEASAAPRAAMDASGRRGSPPGDVVPPASTPPVSRSAASSPGGAFGDDNAGGAATSGKQMGREAPMDPDAAGDATLPSKPPPPTARDRSRRLQHRRPAAGATGTTAGPPPGAVQDAASPTPSTPGPAATAPGTDVRTGRGAPHSELDLNFVNRPVREAYLILGQAHGVRFVVDAAIDRSATLNVNLNGLSLEDVIATMAETANHRIVLLRPGIYHVVAISEGEPLLETPVEEETLPATEGAP